MFIDLVHFILFIMQKTLLNYHENTVYILISAMILIHFKFCPGIFGMAVSMLMKEVQ